MRSHDMYQMRSHDSFLNLCPNNSLLRTKSCSFMVNCNISITPMKSMNALEHQTIENRIPRQIKMDLTKRETDVVQ